MSSSVIKLTILQLMLSAAMTMIAIAAPAPDETDPVPYNADGAEATVERVEVELPSESLKRADDDNAERRSREEVMKKSIRYSVLVAVPVNTFSIAFLAWDWGKTRSFRLGNEGIFGQGTYTGGADKMAHLFAHYLIMRVLYNVYDYTESGGAMKWAYSAGITGALALGIEIGDGFCRNQNGFSFADLSMGLIGIGAAALLERFPAVDGFVSLSAEYLPTRYFRKYPQRLHLLLDDYSGWKFMANIKLAGFRNVGIAIPDFMRYIQFDIGYYTTGFTRYDYRWGEAQMMVNRKNRERNLFIGVSVNLAEFVRDFFTDGDRLASRALQQLFKYYHVPLGARHRFRL
ncbi:MAG: DUF2279 domain-containing protein [Chrysiogenales bacterium]|nr:MAG: DUF2279 domain-containing protein [Chrysiogenales bacterium]